MLKKKTSKKKYLPNSKEKYMCAKHIKFFTSELINWKKDIIKANNPPSIIAIVSKFKKACGVIVAPIVNPRKSILEFKILSETDFDNLIVEDPISFSKFPNIKKPINVVEEGTIIDTIIVTRIGKIIFIISTKKQMIKKYFYSDNFYQSIINKKKDQRIINEYKNYVAKYN